MNSVTELDNHWHGVNSLQFSVLRTDLLSDGGIGNKAYKLAPLQKVLNDTGKSSVMSFGGAWSNHLHALAYRCHQLGVKCVGVVRADEPIDNVLLRSATGYGMKLHFVSRSEYRLRDDTAYCERLCRQLGCDLWIPEGGSTDAAVAGCELLGATIAACEFNPTVVVVPVGTGATFAGIVRQLPASVCAVGLPVVRDDKVHGRIQHWLAGYRDAGWQLTSVVAPRYGAVTNELLAFIVAFQLQTKVVLDPVYTGKVFMYCLSREFTGKLPAHSRVLMVHTGGLLGGFGFEEQIRTLPDNRAAADYLNALRQISACHLSR